MLISSLVTLGVLWHTLRSLPGFVEAIAYLLGVLFASFTFEAYERNNAE